MNRILFTLLIIPLIVSCQPRFEPEITADEIREHIAYLASDELAGRFPGTPGDELLSDYITGAYKQAGLLLHGKTGLMPFDIVTELKAGPGNGGKYNNEILEPGIDLSPFSFSTNGALTAGLVFAGYGFQVDMEEGKWDDYQGVDVDGKWVMILRGVPGKQEASSPFNNFSEDRGKALLASDLGASGVIFVSGEQFDPEDALVELKGKQHPLSIPVVHMTRSTANRILASAGS